MFVLHSFPHGIEIENPSTRLLFVNTRKKNYDSSDINDDYDELAAVQVCNRLRASTSIKV